MNLDNSTFPERLTALTEYLVGLTEEGTHSIAGMVYKEEYSDHTHVEIIIETHPHITVTWVESDGKIDKVGAFCTGFELPFVAIPAPTLMVEE